MKTYLIEDRKLQSQGYWNCFKDLKWVVDAISDDVSRVHLTFLHVDPDNVFVATDGYQMRLATIETPEKIEAGNYKVIKGKGNFTLVEDTDVTYPDYKSCIPELTTGVELIIPPKKTIDLFSGAYSNLIRLMPKNCINLKFFEGLQDETWNVQVGDGTTALRFNNSHKTAIIMPLRA